MTLHTNRPCSEPTGSRWLVAGGIKRTRGLIWSVRAARPAGGTPGGNDHYSGARTSGGSLWDLLPPGPAGSTRAPLLIHGPARRVRGLTPPRPVHGPDKPSSSWARRCSVGRRAFW